MIYFSNQLRCSRCDNKHYCSKRPSRLLNDVEDDVGFFRRKKLRRNDSSSAGSEISRIHEDRSADGNNGTKHSSTKEAPSSLSSETIMETPSPGNREIFDEDKSADGNNGAKHSPTKEAHSSLSSETIMETPLPGNIETFDED